MLEPRLRFKVRPGRASAVVVFILWGTDVRGQICCIPGLYTSSRVVAHDKQPFQRQTDWISGSWMRWQCHSVFRSECVAPGQSCMPILLHTSRTFRPQCAMRPPRQGCVINRSAHCCLHTTVFDTNSFLVSARLLVEYSHIGCTAKPVGSPPGCPASRLLIIVNCSVACIQRISCTFCRTLPSTEYHANSVLWIQEALLSQRDRATRRVSQILASC